MLKKFYLPCKKSHRIFARPYPGPCARGSCPEIHFQVDTAFERAMDVEAIFNSPEVRVIWVKTELGRYCYGP